MVERWHVGRKAVPPWRRSLQHKCLLPLETFDTQRARHYTLQVF